ncbi:MAG: hypothetical protein HQ564_07695 [Candidatus Saganbacteria bacterium]|nr:hypothetical protein [Candidatus Saganbacteria bacterium]
MVPRNKTDKIGAMAEKAMKEAVKKALERHQKLGVPAVFMKDGKLAYLLPNGKVVSKVKSNRKASK